jgi:chromosome segregation ATPase
MEKGGEELQLWEQERAQMQDLLRDRDAKITALQESLHSLDRAKDALEETCEQLEDALEEQRRVFKHLEAQHATHRQLQEATERKVVSLTADLTAAQRHAHASDARVNAAHLEINELKRRFSQKSVEVGTAAHDLMLMTRENQARRSPPRWCRCLPSATACRSGCSRCCTPAPARSTPGARLRWSAESC